MSGNRLVLDVDELRQALRSLPGELAGDGRQIVQAAANEASREIVDKYPTVTGNLKDGVTVAHADSPFGGASIVRSRSPHAYMFEHGTQARHTEIGANRGAMPAQPTLIPVVIRKRAEMYQNLVALLQRAGLTVTGAP